MNTKLEGSFAQRLEAARKAKGWSQSDLARKIWGTQTDGRGYEVARNRDRISAYEGERASPSEDNLKSLADALGIQPDELAPELVAAAAFKEPDPPFEMRIVNNRAFIRINAQISIKSAQSIIAIIEGESEC